MNYVVLLKFNGAEDPLSLPLGHSQEELQQTTVTDLKQKSVTEIPGAPDISRLRLIFGQEELKEDKTLGFYRIQHKDVITCVFRMPGGEAEETQSATISRSDSYEHLKPNM